MSDKMDLIYDLLKQDRTEASDFRKEVREAHKNTGEKITKLSTETSERLTKIEHTNDIQNKQLEEHIAGVDTLKDLHLSNVKRIEENKASIIVLEEPGKVRSKLKKWLIGIGACAGALLAIGRLLGLY